LISFLPTSRENNFEKIKPIYICKEYVWEL
jgi:hypothetical protein